MRARCQFVAALLSIALLSWLSHEIGAAPDDITFFHPDSRNIANRLYRRLHVRSAHGKEYGRDSLDPYLWSETKHLLSGSSHAQAVSLLDEFLREHAERQISDPLQRAILQRDLWAVFDWADTPDAEHQPARRELMARLAPAVRRLALTPEEIARLPDTYARAIKSREFPAAYDSAEPNRAFLPPNLFDPHGPWVCLGAPADALVAPLHDSSFTARSAFLIFARLPEGRAATLAYFKQLAEMQTPLFVTMQSPDWPQPGMVWNAEVPQFSAGSEFALVRRMLLPEKDAHLQLTPVTESVQIRHYTDIPKVDPMASRDVNLARRFQAPSEIELSRFSILRGHSGLRGVTSSDDPLLILPAMSEGFDALEDPRMRSLTHISPFVQCTGCHLGPGIQSMMSFSMRGAPGEGRVLSPRLAETTPQREFEKVIAAAQQQEKWKDLLRLWSAEIAH
jgi:hypothetical protein